MISCLLITCVLISANLLSISFPGVRASGVLRMWTCYSLLVSVLLTVASKTSPSGIAPLITHGYHGVIQRREESQSGQEDSVHRKEETKPPSLEHNKDYTELVEKRREGRR